MQKGKSLSYINTHLGIDHPIAPEDLDGLAENILPPSTRIWLEEHFNGEHSEDYYRGLAAGFHYAHFMESRLERNTWSVWIYHIFIFLARHLRSMGNEEKPEELSS